MTEFPQDDPRDDQPEERSYDERVAWVRDIFREEMDTFMRDQLIPVLDRFSDNIRQQIPTPESITQQVKQELIAEAQAQQAAYASEAQARIAAGINQNGTSHVPADEQDESGRRLDLSAIRPQSLSDLLNALLTLIDHGFSRWEQVQTVRTRASDPFAWARDLASADPYKAAFIGQMMAPHDPLQERLPAIIADSVSKTMAAIMRGRVDISGIDSAGNTGGHGPDPLASYGTRYEPTGGASRERSDDSEADYAQMSRDERPRNGGTAGASARAGNTFTSLIRD